MPLKNKQTNKEEKSKIKINNNKKTNEQTKNPEDSHSIKGPEQNWYHHYRQIHKALICSNVCTNSELDMIGISLKKKKKKKDGQAIYYRNSIPSKP